MVSYSFSSEAQKHQQQRGQSEYRLHSVQRPPASNTYKKPLNTLAQLASGTAHPRVYNVKPVHFRELVQRLTGSASSSLGLHSHQPHPHPRPQPPPLSVPPYLLRPQNQSQTGSAQEQVPYNVEQPFAAMLEEQQLFLDKKGGQGLTTELMLSPNFQAWFSLALLSPGSVP